MGGPDYGEPEEKKGPRHYRIYLRPQPDEMTFDQSLRHVRRAMYWDAVDGQWCPMSLYDIKKWDVLADQLKSAHAREMDAVKAENEKLRELVKDYDKVLSSMHVLCDCDFVPLNDAVLLALRSRMHELGIEVNDD